MLNFVKDLEKLENSFKSSKEIVVGDTKFEISLLTYAEEQQVNSIPKETEEPLAFYERLRIQILSYSIKKINGIEIPDIVEIEGGEKKERSIYIRDDILKKLPFKVIDVLFEAYVDFKDESEDKLNKSIKYEWYKTPEQRQKEKMQKIRGEEKEEKKEESIELKKIEEDESVEEK